MKKDASSRDNTLFWCEYFIHTGNSYLCHSPTAPRACASELILHTKPMITTLHLPPTRWVYNARPYAALREHPLQASDPIRSCSRDVHSRIRSLGGQDVFLASV